MSPVWNTLNKTHKKSAVIEYRKCRAQAEQIKNCFACSFVCDKMLHFLENRIIEKKSFRNIRVLRFDAGHKEKYVEY